MPITFDSICQFDSGSDCCCTLKPTDGSSFLEALAAKYVDLKSEVAIPLDEADLETLVEGINVVDTKGLINHLRALSIPPYTPDSNFDVIRSDFGEMLCYVLLEQNYDIKFAYRSIRDRETIQLPGRGIDAIGVVEGRKLLVILGEAKVSDESKSPPQVVDQKKDGLSKQHLGHISDLDTTARKVWDSGRRALDKQVRDLFLRASLCLSYKYWSGVDLVASSVLVRPQEKYAESDFGSFRNAPGKYKPARVHFWIVCIPDKVEVIVDSWYQQIIRAVR